MIPVCRPRLPIRVAALAALALCAGVLTAILAGSSVSAHSSDSDLVPSNLAVALVDNRVTLSWDAPVLDAASVTGYEILRRRPKEGEGALLVLVADTGSTATTYVDPNDARITGYQVLHRNRETDLSGVFSARVDDTGSVGNSYLNAATPQPHADGPRTERTASNVEESDATDGGICDRTEAVRVGLVDLIDDLYSTVFNCADVTDAYLAAISGSLDLRRSGIDSLKVGDFAGLTHLEKLKLSRNRLRTLPAGVFAGLGSLKDLDLWQNELQTLPAGVFSGLTSLQDLDLEENELRVLPAGVFDGLSLRFLAWKATGCVRCRPGCSPMST